LLVPRKSLGTPIGRLCCFQEEAGDAYRKALPPLKGDNNLEAEPPDIHYQAEPGNENY